MSYGGKYWDASANRSPVTATPMWNILRTEKGKTMKQVKIAYEKCKAKIPHRPPDEIDFGLGFRAALGVVLEWLDYSTEHKEIADKIHEVLE